MTSASAKKKTEQTAAAEGKKKQPASLDAFISNFSSPAAIMLFDGILSGRVPLSRSLAAKFEQVRAIFAVDRFLFKRKELAEIFGCDVRSIDRYAQRGMPKRRDRSFDIREVVGWLQGKIDEARESAAEGSQYKQRLDKAKAELKELEVKEKRGKVISREEVEREWTAKAASYRSELLALPLRAAPLCAHLDAEDISAILSDLVIDVLNRIIGKKKDASTHKKTKKRKA